MEHFQYIVGASKNNMNLKILMRIKSIIAF